MTDISFDAANYPAIRHALIDLHQRIIKKPNPDDVKTCARHLGLLNKKILNFKNDTEVDLLTDYMGLYAQTAENSASLLDNGFIGQNRLIFASSGNDNLLTTVV